MTRDVEAMSYGDLVGGIPGRAQPVLKFAGGKRKLADAIIEKLGPIDEARDVYVEPFVGGGAVFFALRNRYPDLQCVLSDVNPELSNLYGCIKRDVSRVIDILRGSRGHEFRYDEKIYYKIRAWEPECLYEQAARTIYLNRCGYNGMYRLNNKGKFNIPFGKYVNPTICDEPGLRDAALALQGVRITACDFGAVFLETEAWSSAGCRAILYADPPYVPASKSADFTKYAKADFKEADQRRLAAGAVRLVEHGVRVVLSNSDTELVRDIYAGLPFELHPISAARSISCKANERANAKELLIVGRFP